MNGCYLESHLKQLVMRPLFAFREYIFRDVLPTFSNLDGRADQMANEYFERMGSQPASEDFDGDMSGFAEDAHDYALEWYQMMRSLRQTMLNLLAAGLFHLTEQQLASLCQDRGFIAEPPKDTKLDIVAKWYITNLRLDLRALPSWAIVDELRLVANSVKHAEGLSTQKLQKLRPEIFIDPIFAKMEDDAGERIFAGRSVLAPLAGEDLFVTEDLLRKYAEGCESLFREIAGHFNAHGSEYY